MSRNWDPSPHQLFVEHGNVLMVSCEADGPGEPPQLSHSYTLANGREGVVDWTPWKVMTRDDFRCWLRLGTPIRRGYGPLDSKQLEAMEKERAAA